MYPYYGVFQHSVDSVTVTVHVLFVEIGVHGFVSYEVGGQRTMNIKGWTNFQLCTTWNKMLSLQGQHNTGGSGGATCVEPSNW